MTKSVGSASPARCLALVIVATMILVSVWWWLWPDLTATPELSALEPILAQLGALVAALCVSWGWAVATLTALSAAFGRAGRHGPGAATRAWGCPAPMRRVILAICGVGLVTGPLVSVGVAAHGLDRAADPDVGPSIVQGLPLPDRPVSDDRSPGSGSAATAATDSAAPRSGSADSAAPRSGSADSAAPRSGPDHVEVRAGDSLWAIAESRLPQDCGDVTIDQAWREIYRRNRAVIGADPDLIRPGQTLAIPTQENN